MKLLPPPEINVHDIKAIAALRDKLEAYVSAYIDYYRLSCTRNADILDGVSKDILHKHDAATDDLLDAYSRWLQDHHLTTTAPADKEK